MLHGTQLVCLKIIDSEKENEKKTDRLSLESSPIQNIPLRQKHALTLLLPAFVNVFQPIFWDGQNCQSNTFFIGPVLKSVPLWYFFQLRKYKTNMELPLANLEAGELPFIYQLKSSVWTINANRKSQ